MKPLVVQQNIILNDMQLVLIRHLETPYNKAGLLQGQMDIPILDPGQLVLNQIAENKKQLSEMPAFDHILISKLKRTLMTAQHYGYSEQELVVEPLLNELSFGEFEGKTKPELFDRHGELWKNNPEKLILGEPLTKLQLRIEKLIEKYKNSKSLLIFGHGSWSRALCSLNKHGHINQMNQMHIPNNELIRISWNIQ